ncbi:hypothetical protein [Phormidesmis priestleyi]|uniref:hypothetical protein n=1 Tax=Phormidesmis priestleyi TaxID=268141 RepID=UPI001E2F667C|nr:hypothetical protein [Phormidesmis priestleyi]
MSGEGPPFDIIHREHKGRVARVVLLSLDSSKVEGGEGGMEMKVQFRYVTRLAVLQPRELLGISEDKFDLKPQLVESVQVLGRLLDIGGEQHHKSRALGVLMVEQIRQADRTFERH